MVDFILNYGWHILIGLLFLAGLVFFVLRQERNIKEWLLYAVIEAEKNLGAKTGKIKLRQVYDWFINTFPIISKIIAFNTFSKLVDLALVEMKEILATNSECKTYVEGAEE
jgi:hypothetical protein